MSSSEAVSYLAGLAVTILGYFLKQKDDEIKGMKAKQEGHEKEVADIKIRQAVQEQANKSRDERSERIEVKVDRLLEKLGA